MDRYADFLEARRELLADAANDFLDTLLRGRMPEPPTPPTTMPEPPTPPTTMAERDAAHVPGGIAHEGERDQLIKVNQWVVDQGLPAGEFSYELVDGRIKRALRHSRPRMAGRLAGRIERAGCAAAR